MSQQKRFSLLYRILMCLQLFYWVSVSLTEASKIPLTQDELREKYGQCMVAFLVKFANKIKSTLRIYFFSKHNF